MSAKKRKDAEAAEAPAVPDAPAPEAPVEGAGTPAKGAGTTEAEHALAAGEAERRSLFDQLVRLKAEFENFRKRVDRERPELVAYGRGELLSRLIPLYDVLLSAHEEVLRHQEWVKAAANKADHAPGTELVRGLEMIFVEFTKLFGAEGIEAMETLGKPYDFNRHEVVGQVETDGEPEGTVVEEVQRGYLLRGKVLRAAKVRVAKGVGG